MVSGYIKDAPGALPTEKICLIGPLEPWPFPWGRPICLAISVEGSCRTITDQHVPVQGGSHPKSASGRESGTHRISGYVISEDNATSDAFDFRRPFCHVAQNLVYLGHSPGFWYNVR